MIQHLETGILTTHVAAGFASLLFGILNLLNKKGAKAHRRLGMAYFYSMFYVFISALIILIFFRFTFFLTAIAVFSFYMCFSGYRVLKRKKAGQAAFIDKLAAGLAITFGVLLFGTGIYFIIKSNMVLGILSIIFGMATANAGWQDVKIFRMQEMPDKQWWWYHHMQAMIGSLIAATTAFLVQNGVKIFPGFPYPWLFWLLPAAIGTPLIIVWIRRYRTKFAKR